MINPFLSRPRPGSIDPGHAAACGVAPPSRRKRSRRPVHRAIDRVAALAVATLLGCRAALAASPFLLLHPKGPIGADEKSLIIVATGLMLIVVVPVIAMTLWFAWHYRATNTRATFAPNWAHSSRIELVVWLVPCLIVGTLATITWGATHKLDPYRPIASAVKPLDVDVVSLDWKWLFIYPRQHVASVNEFAFPVGTPVRFHLTSASVMNSFFIPQLGSQIYTMSGMQTVLSLLADQPGNYQGISANYSGAGFSDMTFEARAMTTQDFRDWMSKVRSSPRTLTLPAYRQLEKPSESVPVTYYGKVEPSIYHDALTHCTDGGPCTDGAMKMAAPVRPPTGPQVVDNQ